MGFFANKHRGHVTAFLAELAGTFLFLFFSFAIAQVANTPAPSDDDNTPGAGLPSIPKIFFIASGFGASVAINVWLFYRVSGGMFNPAVGLVRPGSFMLILSGHLSPLVDRGGSITSMLCRLPCTDCGRYCCCRSSIRNPTWTDGRECSIGRRHFDRSRPLHRNVCDLPAHVCGDYAGCGQAQGYLPCPHRYWHSPLHRTSPQ